MSHKFNCTYCGKELGQESILFDFLNPLMNSVVEKAPELHHLQLLVKEEKLREIFNNGTTLPDPGRKAQRLCKFTVQDFFSLLGDENNLGISNLGNVDWEHLNKYIGDQLEEFVPSEHAEQNHAKAGDESPADEGSQAVIDEAPQEANSDDVPTTLPVRRGKKNQSNNSDKRRADEQRKKDLEDFRKNSPLRLIIQKQRDDAQSVDFNQKETQLCNELRDVRNYLFLEKNQYSCVFCIQLNEEAVQDSDEQIVTGYKFFNEKGASARQFLSTEVRQCPVCGEAIFKGAGTAPHKTVVFIGSQGTGKTSTMIALAHYSRYKHINTSDPGLRSRQKLWEKAEACSDGPLDITFACESKSKETELLKNMDLFFNALPPEKTKTQRDRNDNAQAFSITLNVFPESGHRSFLSLMDVPGEICNEDTGHIDNEMADKYSYLFSCDSYVLCFQHPRAEKTKRQQTAAEKRGFIDMSPETMVRNWAMELQKMRKEKTNSACNVPMIIAVTKSPDLEDNSRTTSQGKVREDDKYLFRYDKVAILGDDDAKSLILSFNAEDSPLREGFYAYMRCCPFGFVVEEKNEKETSKKEDVSCLQEEQEESYRTNETVEIVDDQRDNQTEVMQDQETQQGIVDTDNTKGEEHKTPRPKQVDKLMQWILYVSGCIPIQSSKEGFAKKEYVVPLEYRNLLPEEKYAWDHREPSLKDSKPKTFSNKEHFSYVLKTLFNKEWMEIRKIAYIRTSLFVNCDREKRYVESDNAIQFIQTARDCFKQRKRSLKREQKG